MNRPILHPVLVALTPILFLVQHNRGEPIRLQSILVALGGALLVTLAVWLVARAIVKDRVRAALLTSFATFLLLTYGHYWNAFGWLKRQVGSPALLPSDHWAVVLPWLAVLVGGTWFLGRTRLDLSLPNSFATYVAAGMLTASIVGTSIPVWLPEVELPEDEGLARLDELDAPKNPPDIYYIILDGYAHPRIVENELGYPEDPLASGLQQRRFMVPERSRANYPKTTLSLSSTLNMDYLDVLEDVLGEKEGHPGPAFKLIENNRLLPFLRSQGYEVVHFDSGASGTESNPNAAEVVRCGHLSMFDKVVMDTTALRLLPLNVYETDQRARVNCMFEELERLPGHRANVDAPAFVFAHFISPHDPYVFDLDGEPIDGSRILQASGYDMGVQRKLYGDQLIYVGKRTLQAVDAILESSDRDPVIIVQSDHGTDLIGNWDAEDEGFLKARLRNFNAFYLPDAPDELGLDERVTNVNTFRFVLNAYFDAGLELLQNKSYFIQQETPYLFNDVTDRVRFGD